MATELANEGFIPHELISVIRDVYAAASPAIHAKEVSKPRIDFVREVVPGLIAALKAMKKKWVFNPHSGGKKISPGRKIEVTERLHRYADHKLKDKCDRINVRFRGALCYVDAIQKEPGKDDFRFPLCRLRHFDIERWSIALFTWSNEKYEPSIFPSGEWFGTIEECLELGATFL